MLKISIIGFHKILFSLISFFKNAVPHLGLGLSGMVYNWTDITRVDLGEQLHGAKRLDF